MKPVRVIAGDGDNSSARPRITVDLIRELAEKAEAMEPTAAREWIRQFDLSPIARGCVAHKMVFDRVPEATIETILG
jgi:hypothetical protein